MSGCKGCDINICPNSEENREIVDSLINKNFESVDFLNENEIKDATLKTVGEVMQHGIKPCNACLKINAFVKEKKEELNKNIINILDLNSLKTDKINT